MQKNKTKECKLYKVCIWAFFIWINESWITVHAKLGFVFHVRSTVPLNARNFMIETL
jgi:hypothetical protein